MPPRIRAVSSSVIIHGQEFPCLSWNVRLGSSGSLTTVSISTSLALLKASGLDVEAAAQEKSGLPIDIYAGYEGEGEHIFGGVLDECDWDFDQDTFSIQGLDHGCVLVESKQTISKIDYQNQTIGQIVRAIAGAHGFKSAISEPGVTAGQELWGESAYVPPPQPWWSVLQTLARQVGYEVQVRPDKTLFFGPPENAAGDPVTGSWGAGVEDSDDLNPIKGLRVKYSPRRNGNVDVRVISYHPQRAELVDGSASYGAIEAAIAGRKANKSATSKKKTQGRYTGQLGAQTSPSGKPVLTFHMDGLTKEQAQAKAAAIAKDIAKRQIIISGTMEGLPSMKVHSKLNLRAGLIDMMTFAGRAYTITNVGHSYNFPVGGRGAGFTSDFTAMTGPT